MLAVAERVHALLGPRLFFVAPRTTEGSIEAVLVERLLEALGLHDVGVLGTAVGERVDALGDAVRVDVSDQLQAHFLDHLVAEAVHLLEFPLGVDVHHRKRQLARKEGFACQVQHHGRILADRVQHHRVIELSGHLTNDVDALRLQLFQMRQFVDHSYSRKYDLMDGQRAVFERATLSQHSILFRRPTRTKQYKNIPCRFSLRSGSDSR
ncbi:hypothetical protein D3C78_1140140 [compost metagenome]